jgi:outer membrane protein
MKKLLFILFAICIAGSASAQINKGSVLVGASSNLNFSSVKFDGFERFSNFDLDVKVGYFVIDNLTVGLDLGYQKLDDFTVSSFGLFSRYYYQGKIFGGVGFNFLKYEDQDSETSIPFEIGYAAFITENIAIEPAFNLSIGENSNSYGLRVGFALYLNR